jgi:hypothetical protein
MVKPLTEGWGVWVVRVGLSKDVTSIELSWSSSCWIWAWLSGSYDLFLLLLLKMLLSLIMLLLLLMFLMVSSPWSSFFGWD